MICPGRAANITHYVLQTSRLPGDMVEFGCYAGRTAALIAACCGKRLWLYDSFEGLPDRQPQDDGALGHFKRGALAVQEKLVLALFDKHGLHNAIVCKSWFNLIPWDQLPEHVGFAHLDGDLHDSIRDSLRLVYPRLVHGGVCIVDDYGWSGLPGVKIAVDSYMEDKFERVRPLVTGNPDGCQAVIVKV